jgi:hypothetical protein
MAKASADPAKIEKQRQAWQKTRARGKQFYILTRGVLGFGLTCALYWIFDKDLLHLSLPKVALCLLFWGGFGYLFGLWMWNSNEKRYCNLS